MLNLENSSFFEFPNGNIIEDVFLNCKAMYIKVCIIYLISRKEKSKGHQWQHNYVRIN